jgi:hypothetical protein
MRRKFFLLRRKGNSPRDATRIVAFATAMHSHCAVSKYRPRPGSPVRRRL